MKIHPNESALQDLFRQLDGGSLRMLEHVLGCPACRERAQGLLASWRQSEPGKLLRLPAAVPDYDRALENATRDLLARTASIERERDEATALFPFLEGCPPERRKLLLLNSTRYQTWGMLELLLQKSWQTSFEDSLQVEHWAELALSLAGRLDAGNYGPANLEDMRGRAWSYIGNARRIRAELAKAEEAFGIALSHLRRGTGDVVERARLLDLVASLRKIERRFDQATALLKKSVNIFLEAGERHRAGKSLVKLATVYDHALQPEKGIPLLYDAIQLIDGYRDPRLLFFAQHNLTILLADAGKTLEAQRLFARTEILYRRFPQSWVQGRRNWVQGKIARRIGRPQEAEQYLLAAQHELATENAFYDVALISLELASLYEEQRRVAEIRPLAEEVISYFGPLQIRREVQTAMDLLQAAESGIA